MTAGSPNPKADAILEKAESWREEYAALRKIALSCGLAEEVKWGWPCYTDKGRNIILIHGFKDYCACLVFKGALLPDPAHILIQQTENVQSSRQIRFTNLAEITGQESVLKDYIRAAIEVERAGLTVKKEKPEDRAIPDELQAAFDSDGDFATAFSRLTPGRQRGYLLFISAAKQSATRASRIEKYREKIMAGKGMDD